MKVILKSILFLLLGLFILINSLAYEAYAAEFKIAIMQDKIGAAKKLLPLKVYLEKKGIKTIFVPTINYYYAAKMFTSGEVDGMFSGSGVAAIMIIKELAYPLVRPLSSNGWSTYWAVVIAPKGSTKFTHKAEYFDSKKIAYSGLASSGEFFFRSIEGIQNINSTIRIAPSHGNALYMVSEGIADVAVVKNRVWDSLKGRYPGIDVVGEDKGENPDGTLIISKTADSDLVEKINSALLALKDDTSAEGMKVRDSMKIKGYIKTTTKDFNQTLALLSKAGVDKGFVFSSY